MKRTQLSTARERQGQQGRETTAPTPSFSSCTHDAGHTKKRLSSELLTLRAKFFRARNQRAACASGLLLGGRVSPPGGTRAGGRFGRVEPVGRLSAPLGHLAVLGPPVLEPNPYLLLGEADVHR